MSKTYKTDEEKKKRSKRSNGSTEQKENKPAKNTKNQAKDGISKSKQLLMKEKMCRRSRTTKSKEPRVCPNGKPIPTLADLEKMFDDSDEERSTSTVPKLVNKLPQTPTPVEPQSPVNSEHKLLSPATINRISERMMELISNVSDPIELIEHISPSPVIPPKKRKKPEQPYIVGCKDRPQVIKKSNTNFCKGDADYGVNNITNSDEDEPCKRGKRSKIPKYSKSIFNAQSDKIADHLKNIDSNCNDSSDSDKTIEYEYMTNSIFAPLPSTSRDNETFIKNDELFSESLKGNNTFTENAEESDLEIIDVPTDTIVIEEVEDKPSLSIVKNENKEINNSCVQIVEPANQSDTCIVIDLEADNPIEIKNNDINKTLDEHGTINLIDDDYSSIQFDVPHNSSGFVEEETIDVDELIAQSQSIIQKYKRDSINTVIDVDSISTKPTLTSNNINNEINEQLISDTQVRNTVESLPCNSQTLENEITTAPNLPNNAIEETVTKFFSNMQNIRPDFLNSVLLQFDQLNRSESRITKENQISESAIAVNCDSINTPSTSTHNNNRNSMESLLTGNRKQTRKKKTVSNSPESPSTSNGKGLGDCPICMDCLTNNPIASTICGHVFCLKCIEAAVKANGKRCPTCRKLLKKNGYHQLFI